MPVRETYQGRLVNLVWDPVDAVGGVAGGIVGALLGNGIDGPPAIGGLGVLGAGVGIGLSSIRSVELPFYDDFKDPDFTKKMWTPDGGNWKIVDHVLDEDASVAGFDYWTMAGQPSWSNYKVSALCKMVAGFPAVAVCGRVQSVSPFKGYTLQIGGGSILDVWTPSLKVLAHMKPAPKIELGKYYLMELEFKDNLITGYVDGVKVAEAVDNTFISGAVGFKSPRTHVQFDNVKVYPAAVSGEMFGAAPEGPGASMRLGKYQITG